LNKLISQSSFHLKGTGWYVTDYSKKSPTESTKRDASSASGSEKSTPGGSDSKAATSDS